MAGGLGENAPGAAGGAAREAAGGLSGGAAPERVALERRLATLLRGPNAAAAYDWLNQPNPGQPNDSFPLRCSNTELDEEEGFRYMVEELRSCGSHETRHNKRRRISLIYMLEELRSYGSPAMRGTSFPGDGSYHHILTETVDGQGLQVYTRNSMLDICGLPEGDPPDTITVRNQLNAWSTVSTLPSRVISYCLYFMMPLGHRCQFPIFDVVMDIEATENPRDRNHYDSVLRDLFAFGIHADLQCKIQFPEARLLAHACKQRHEQLGEPLKYMLTFEKQSSRFGFTKYPEPNFDKAKLLGSIQMRDRAPISVFEPSRAEF